MMEGGNIDWASHANDGATVIREVMNFQKAIDVPIGSISRTPTRR